MSITQLPTDEEIKALEQEEQLLQKYIIYKYQCHHPQCNREFLSNLSPSDAICPFTPKIHSRITRAIRLLGQEIKFIKPYIYW